MISIAFYLDEIPFVDGPTDQLKGYTRKFIDKWCAMANMTPIWIDETRTLRKTNKTAFWSWQELLEGFPDHRFVFLDSQGDVSLDEFDHPVDSVIYCIGADQEKGFGDLDISSQEKIKLQIDSQWHGFTVVPMVTSSRMMCRPVGV